MFFRPTDFRRRACFRARGRFVFLLALAVFFIRPAQAGGARPLLEKGWEALVRDNDAEALRYFESAYEQALAEKDTAATAEALLNMGICYYSVSYGQGLEYTFKAMAEYKKLERSQPRKALEGRSRCLQLIGTIYSRQGKYREAIALSKEAMAGFPAAYDTSGYLGLIYNSLGVAYGQLHFPDSAEYYHRLALEERLRTGNTVYLPASYLYVADIEREYGRPLQSRLLYDRAKTVADSTGNRQAQVSSLLGLGKWHLAFDKNESAAESLYLKAKQVAAGLTDQTFYIKALQHLMALKKQQGDYRGALAYHEEMTAIKDRMYSWDREKTVKSLEVQFEVAEKDRQLRLARQEKEITQLSNYLLWICIGFLAVISVGAVLFMWRINKRDKQLLATKETLMAAIEARKQLQERQMQNELEFKESQLSAMTLQMLQKNELMQELKTRLEENHTHPDDHALSQIIHKGLNRDKEWSDFNAQFEGMNKNFYARLKQAYPGISPNDLKICALIKLNLSIKEMAGILNISPDSVKTARYRLRKKLQLNTEDNLTDFILSL